MTREEINELYWLNKELDDLQDRLKELEETAGVGSSKISGEMHSKNTKSDIVEQVALKIIKLKERINNTMCQILDEKEKIENFIETIPNSQIRTIVRLRNIDLMTWEQIGQVMNLDRKTVSKKYNDFIKWYKPKNME